MKIDKVKGIESYNPNAPTDRFKKGKRFKARIKNITPKSVEIEVEEGIMTATINERMGFGIGDIAEFEVVERDEDKIKLKHIKQAKIEDKFDIRI